MYVNGYYSDWFTIKSGVAQGCPLSPLLFLIVGQALKIAIYSECALKGIKINKEIYKLIQFADDTTILMTSIDFVMTVGEWIVARFEKDPAAVFFDPSASRVAPGGGR